MDSSAPFALSLSGGGICSLAYAGFDEVLRQHKLESSCYAGLSGGAILAVLLASNMSADNAIQFFQHLKTFKILNTHLSHIEVIDHTKLISLLRSLLPYKTFEDLPTRAAVFASDVTNKEPVLIQNGDIASAIVASCSIFPLLQPVKRRGRLLGDGGMTVYYGANYLRPLGFKKVIGVDVTGITEGPVKGLLSALYKQINTTVTENARHELEEWPVDLDVRITFPGASIFSLQRKAHHFVNFGKKTAQHYLGKIHHMLSPHE
ncbi:patatin-like phospholipase family protein [Candidatus Gottesmanbacteria bacterium]|nr:patatin-like phospholipase family protein [Candidatus Gottesmanbacteria bacterium]